MNKLLIDLVNEYQDGLEDTDMEGFDITLDQAKNLLEDLVTYDRNRDGPYEELEHGLDELLDTAVGRKALSDYLVNTISKGMSSVQHIAIIKLLVASGHDHIDSASQCLLC